MFFSCAVPTRSSTGGTIDMIAASARSGLASRRARISSLLSIWICPCLLILYLTDTNCAMSSSSAGSRSIRPSSPVPLAPARYSRIRHHHSERALKNFGLPVGSTSPVEHAADAISARHGYPSSRRMSVTPPPTPVSSIIAIGTLLNVRPRY